MYALACLCMYTCVYVVIYQYGLSPAIQVVCSKGASAVASERENGSGSDATDAEFESQPQVWCVSESRGDDHV